MRRAACSTLEAGVGGPDLATLTSEHTIASDYCQSLVGLRLVTVSSDGIRDMVHISARIVVRTGAAPAMQDIFRRLADASRQEPGCLSYEVFQAAERPELFQTIERWRDEPAASAHMATPHVQAAIKSAQPLFAAAPEITMFVPLR